MGSTKEEPMKRNLATGLVIGLSVTSLLCAVIPSRAQVPAIIGDTAPEIKFEKLLEAPPEADTHLVPQ